ncbi:MAG: response regulator [Acidobacteriia bacterium]|nr:response regulator [Terriglobia bacterium]
MTAQNLGKKILTEAGYEVVAVSNGAQAVKKIAECKPDLAVLDVFMPGYSGVEVCERVKKAQETAHLPVLLTVGKMEPFKPEEGTRAGADGLIVKPFEASELLAAVKRIEGKLAAPVARAAPEQEATVKIPVEEFQDASYEEWKVSAPETPVEEEEVRPTEKTAVPEAMGAEPAFGMESLEGPEAATVAPSDTQPIEPPPAVRTTAAITPPAQVVAHTPAARTTAEMPAPLQAEAAATASIVEEVAPAAAPHEIEFTSAPQPVEVEHAPAPGFEPTVSQEAVSVSSGRDPSLVTDSDELSKFATKFGVEGAEPIPVGLASEMPGLYADSQAPAAEAPVEEAEAAASVSVDADFEARVAAAMAGYEEPPAPVAESESAMAPAPAAEAEAMGRDTAALIAQMQKAVENLPLDTTPHVEAAAEPAPVAPPPPEPVQENVPDHALAAAMAAAVGASVEPQVAAAVAPPPGELTQALAPNVIADIVHRVVERMKPDLAAEIARELEAMMKK